MTMTGTKAIRTHSIFWIFQTFIASCVTPYSPDPTVTQQWLKDDNANRMRIHSETAEIRSKFESKKYINPLIWRVEYKDRISYLFGTMHVSIRSNEIPFDIHKHLDAANTVVFEIDPNDRSDVTFQNKSVGQGPCLDKTLSSTAWKNLKYDLLVIDVEEFRCLEADDAHDLWEAFQFAKLIKGEPLLDFELLKQSQRNQKKTVFLETTEEAMNALVKSKAKKSDSHKNVLKKFNEILEGDRVQVVIDSYKSLYEIGIAYKE
ncbi:MAG: TraB/GumN family protein, partial [Proteobacteria bacterium]|nr:TraB/GumN family protein [Pseudomonadota bacterium]